MRCQMLWNVKCQEMSNVNVWPGLSWSVPVCPSLSRSVLVYPGLSITYQFGVHWVWAHNLSMSSSYFLGLIMRYHLIVMINISFIMANSCLSFLGFLILLNNQMSCFIWQSVLNYGVQHINILKPLSMIV